MQIASLRIHPVKGAAAIEVDACDVTDRGLQNDRRFMIVDGEGTFVTQRTRPELALVKTAIAGDALTLTHGASSVRVPLAGVDGPRLPVRVWSSHLEVPRVSDEADGFVSEVLGERASLVYMPDEVQRTVSTKWTRRGELVSFADGFPILLATTASLDDLNARMEAPLPMERFRPNVVVSGSAPWEEDRWKSIRAGVLEMRLVKPCDRCVVTTIDQQTGAKGKEPLRTLATFRDHDGGVMFGWNVLHEGTGRLHVGDAVTVLARRPDYS